MIGKADRKSLEFDYSIVGLFLEEEDKSKRFLLPFSEVVHTYCEKLLYVIECD